MRAKVATQAAGAPSGRRKKSQRTLFNKSVIRGMVTKNGKTHTLSRNAFETVSAMGDDILKKIIRKCKFLIQNQPSQEDNQNVTIFPRHIIAAVNALKVPGEITEDAIVRASRQAYDAKGFKQSTIRRKMAQYAGKNWVKKDSNKYIWCIVITLLEEIFSQAIENKNGENTRITSQGIYHAINRHPDKLLRTFSSYVGEGVGFV